MLRSGGCWVQSQLHAVVRLLYRWRFAYVENLTWVHMGPNNRPLAEAAPHARCSHSTLLMFRKDGEERRRRFTLPAEAAALHKLAAASTINLHRFRVMSTRGKTMKHQIRMILRTALPMQ